MTTTNYKHLSKNKVNFLFNYKLEKYEHFSEMPMRYDFYHLQGIRKTCWKISANKNNFTYYCCISVKEGLKTSELMLGKYDKEVYQKCQHCYQVIEIKKGFKENAFICNICLKILKNI